MNAARRNEIINAIRDLTNRIDSLDRRNLVEFKKVNGQVSTLETRIDVRMDELESHAAKEVASFGARIDGVATAFKQVNYAIDELGTRVTARLDALESKVTRRISLLEARINGIGQHFASYEAA